MLSLPLVDVLKNRGISDLDRFLAPSSWSDLPSPFELEEMEPAVTQILHAIRSQRPMTIVGDYDCDGVLSTAILETTLRRLGAQPTVYLPHRNEGYGLSNEVVHRFSTHGTGLLITIDNGINAAGPVRLAQRLGIGVVIVDHHHIETRAEATAVWSEHFCASGIAVLLSGALLETAGTSKIGDFLAGLSRLAAIASIELGVDQLFRLVGIGLSNFQSSEEPPLFSGGDEESGREALANLPALDEESV